MSEERVTVGHEVVEDIRMLHVSVHYLDLINQAKFLEEQAERLVAEAKRLRFRAEPMAPPLQKYGA